MKNIQDKISAFPTITGVYLMKDKGGKIIYVGKAKNLRSRVRSYFLKKREWDRSIKTQKLVDKIDDIEFIGTRTETEALLLECELIKKHKPYYNVSLKDDKSYPYLKITVQEKWPGIYLIRRPEMDGALYFGPYSSVGSLKYVLKMLTKIFQIRDCSNVKFKNRTRPCLSYEIGRCTAPCVHFVKEDRYKLDVTGLISFLRGRVSGLEKDLKIRMKNFSETRKYEEAAHTRDQLVAISDMMEKQNVISTSKDDKDVIAFDIKVSDIAEEAHTQTISLLFLYIRAGVLLSKRLFQWKKIFFSQNLETDVLENIKSFLTQYYETHFVPNEILIADTPMRGDRRYFSSSDFQDLTQLLREKTSHKVTIIIGRARVALKLIDLAQQNLKLELSGRTHLDSEKKKTAKTIQKLLHLKNPAHHIECYDISNISGTSAVGSMITFKEGTFRKDLYRRFKIKTVHSINDFSMMREVLSRRCSTATLKHPDLILIDGGRGHISAACNVLDDLNISVDVASIAKKKPRVSKLAETERLYLRGRKNPVILKPRSEMESFFSKIRDEAHRFAITYHRKLRASSQTRSVLDEIHGLGPSKKKKLLEYFSSVEEIKFSTVETLSKVPGISTQLAQNILVFFQKR